MGGVSMINEIDLFKKQIDFKAVIAECRKHEQVECPVKHHLTDGLYTRETFMPKGAFVVGKKHRNETMNILLKGTILVYMGDDKPPKELVAPCIFSTPPGTQKIGYMKEDVIWVNTIPTKETDLQKIEQNAIIGENEIWLSGNDHQNNSEEHY